MYTLVALPLQASSSILSQPEKPVFRPHLEHKHTEPCPFPFEQRYQGKARRQDLVQKELEKQQQELAQVSRVCSPLQDWSSSNSHFMHCSLGDNVAVHFGQARVTSYSLPFFLPYFQKRKFAAQAVPEFQPMTERPATVATKPQPFNLLTEARGAKYQEEFDNKVSGLTRGGGGYWAYVGVAVCNMPKLLFCSR